MSSTIKDLLNYGNINIIYNYGDDNSFNLADSIALDDYDAITSADTDPYYDNYDYPTASTYADANAYSGGGAYDSVDEYDRLYYDDDIPPSRPRHSLGPDGPITNHLPPIGNDATDASDCSNHGSGGATESASATANAGTSWDTGYDDGYNAAMQELGYTTADTGAYNEAYPFPQSPQNNMPIITNSHVSGDGITNTQTSYSPNGSASATANAAANVGGLPNYNQGSGAGDNGITDPNTPIPTEPYGSPTNPIGDGIPPAQGGTPPTNLNMPSPPVQGGSPYNNNTFEPYFNAPIDINIDFGNMLQSLGLSVVPNTNGQTPDGQQMPTNTQTTTPLNQQPQQGNGSLYTTPTGANSNMPQQTGTMATTQPFSNTMIGEQSLYTTPSGANTVPQQQMPTGINSNQMQQNGQQLYMIPYQQGSGNLYMMQPQSQQLPNFFMATPNAQGVSTQQGVTAADTDNSIGMMGNSTPSYGMLPSSYPIPTSPYPTPPSYLYNIAATDPQWSGMMNSMALPGTGGIPFMPNTPTAYPAGGTYLWGIAANQPLFNNYMNGMTLPSLR